MSRVKGNIVILGHGSVAQCFIPLLQQNIDFNKVIIFDKDYKKERSYDGDSGKIDFVNDEVLKDGLHHFLSSWLKSGDILIDLAWNIDTLEVLKWCQQHNVNYINTSIELWDPYNYGTTVQEKTLYHRHMKIRDWWNSLSDTEKASSPTMIVEHGANPGWVSHSVKEALIDIALSRSQSNITGDAVSNHHYQNIMFELQKGNYAMIAKMLGVKTIHISERDTQITSYPKQVNEFVNTWSIEGFREEGIAPAELGYGTHEDDAEGFQAAYLHGSGPKNQIALESQGIDTLVKSWVPDQEIIGMMVRHGEAFTISDHLSVRVNDKIEYRPTVHYAYCPCDSAWNSLHEFKMRNYKLQENQRILRDTEIISGQDILGVLLMGDFGTWWTGSMLSIEESRRLAPNQNATTLQVAASVLGALVYIINNPEEGYRVPDDLSHREIMDVVKPYLGVYISKKVDWKPKENTDWKLQDFLIKP